MGHIRDILLEGPSDDWIQLDLFERRRLLRLIIQTLHMGWIQYLHDINDLYWERCIEEDDSVCHALLLSHNYQWYLERYKIDEDELQHLVKHARHVPLIAVLEQKRFPPETYLRLACSTGDLKCLELGLSAVSDENPIAFYHGPDLDNWVTTLIASGVSIDHMPFLFDHPQYYELLQEFNGRITWQTSIISYYVHCLYHGETLCPNIQRPADWQLLTEFLAEERKCSALRLFCRNLDIEYNCPLVYLVAYSSSFLKEIHGPVYQAKNKSIVAELESNQSPILYYDGCVAGLDLAYDVCQI